MLVEGGVGKGLAGKREDSASGYTRLIITGNCMSERKGGVVAGEWVTRGMDMSQVSSKSQGQATK